MRIFIQTNQGKVAIQADPTDTIGHIKGDLLANDGEADEFVLQHQGHALVECHTLQEYDHCKRDPGHAVSFRGRGKRGGG